MSNGHDEEGEEDVEENNKDGWRHDYCGDEVMMMMMRRRRKKKTRMTTGTEEDEEKDKDKDNDNY